MQSMTGIVRRRLDRQPLDCEGDEGLAAARDWCKVVRYGEQVGGTQICEQALR